MIESLKAKKRYVYFKFWENNIFFSKKLIKLIYFLFIFYFNIFYYNIINDFCIN